MIGPRYFCLAQFSPAFYRPNHRVKKLSEAYFLIPCEKLESVSGQNVQSGETLSTKDVGKAMLGHVYKIPVAVTVRLGSTEIGFEEATGLSVDDVLLLDKKVTTPIELIINGKTQFRGRLAKSDGKQAVVITEVCGTK